MRHRHTRVIMFTVHDQCRYHGGWQHKCQVTEVHSLLHHTFAARLVRVIKQLKKIPKVIFMVQTIIRLVTEAKDIPSPHPYFLSASMVLEQSTWMALKQSENPTKVTSNVWEWKVWTGMRRGKMRGPASTDWGANTMLLHAYKLHVMYNVYMQSCTTRSKHWALLALMQPSPICWPMWGLISGENI